MSHTRKKSFYPKRSSFSNKFFFDAGSTLIIIQRQSEKKILDKEFYNVSDFELKKTTRQILIIKLYKASAFGLKKKQRVRFWINFFSTGQIFKNCLHSEITFWFILHRENDKIYDLRAFLETWFWIEIFISCQILNWKNTTR